jgi:hypothetical protein
MGELGRIKQAMIDGEHCDGDLAWCVDRIDELEAQCSDGEIAKTKQALNHWRDKAERLKQEKERLLELLEQAIADAIEGGALFEKKQLGDIRYKEGMERAAEIVKSQCPNCGGQGFMVYPDQFGEPDQEQCQWCYEIGFPLEQAILAHIGE